MKTRIILKRIEVNWNNKKSIKSAEKQKAILENDGYKQVGTETGINTATLIYNKQEHIK